MDTQCKTDSRAPHGFLRNASHCEDRYVCECEFWEPPAKYYNKIISKWVSENSNWYPSDTQCGMKIGSPSTFNIGRNAKKRNLRDGKPRKHWRTLARDYGYTI